ncbi:hypothetical protein [Pseudomonas syringae]|uniref:Uncharacterized protein n=1 Tax=Pseudomonas syringae TaxID=317 RepID=A0A085V7H2_PSESX|nr:hypothetical protein [Pseudomonas syringae]KFE51385.1 hypothetical protein IV01_24355 [Pseudomonas syringae]
MKPFNEDWITNKTLPWLFVVTLLSMLCLGLTMANAEDNSRPVDKPRAAAEIYPAPWQNDKPEDDHSFECYGSVLIGSRHFGDEKGRTDYRCGWVNQFDRLEVVDKVWSGNLKESEHFYDCPPNTVMTGRRHRDDEHGSTAYQCAKVIDSWGNAIQVVPGPQVDVGDYENSVFECPENQAITYRGHDGDTESGNVFFKCGTLW